jgi:hypothetical protein
MTVTPAPCAYGEPAPTYRGRADVMVVSTSSELLHDDDSIVS